MDKKNVQVEYRSTRVTIFMIAKTTMKITKFEKLAPHKITSRTVAIYSSQLTGGFKIDNMECNLTPAIKSYALSN